MSDISRVTNYCCRCLYAFRCLFFAYETCIYLSRWKSESKLNFFCPLYPFSHHTTRLFCFQERCNENEEKRETRRAFFAAPGRWEAPTRLSTNQSNRWKSFCSLLLPCDSTHCEDLLSKRRSILEILLFSVLASL